MGRKLENFMWERFKAAPLGLGLATCTPGMILETDWPGIWDFYSGPPRFPKTEMFAWNSLNVDRDLFPTMVTGANIIQENIKDKFGFDGTLSLPQYGLSLGLDLDFNDTAVVKFTGVTAVVFKNGAHQYELLRKILELKRSDSWLWEKVNDDFLITEAFYVTSLTAEFSSDWHVTVDVDLKQGDQEITGTVTVKGLGAKSVELVNPTEAPFAVRGLHI